MRMPNKLLSIICKCSIIFKAVIRIDVDPNEMDSFVLAFGKRKSFTKAVKEMTDLASSFFFHSFIARLFLYCTVLPADL